MQKSDVNLQTILVSIYVFDGGSSNAGTLSYHSVDFLNIWNEFGSRLQQLMDVHPTPGSVCSGFYHLQYDNLGIIRPHECCQVPSGKMCIMGSGSIPIHIIGVYKNNAELLCNPKVAYKNYLQECFMFERHGISYDQCMYIIIDKLIDNANEDTQAHQNAELDSSLLYGRNANVKHYDRCPIPNGIGGDLNDDSFDSGPSVSHDFDIADKIRGFLNHSSGNFSFIGPDRDLVTIFYHSSML